MKKRWLFLSLILITACGKPVSKFPEKEVVKPDQQQEVKPIVAPPARYGNKIVFNDYFSSIFS